MTDEELFASMAEQLSDVTASEDDLTLVSTLTLHDELERLDKELIARGELLNPTTHDAREMHSRRGAIVVTLKNRRAL